MKRPKVRERSGNLCSQGHLFVAVQQNAGNQTVLRSSYDLSVLYSYCNSFFIRDVRGGELELINAHLFDSSTYCLKGRLQKSGIFSRLERVVTLQKNSHYQICGCVAFFRIFGETYISDSWGAMFHMGSTNHILGRGLWGGGTPANPFEKERMLSHLPVFWRRTLQNSRLWH